MRRALTLAAVAVIALGAFLSTPSVTEAAKLGFPYYGGIGGGTGLLPCTGFFQFGGHSVVSDQAIGTDIDSEGNEILRPQCTNFCQIFEFANRLIIFAVTIMVTIITPVFVFIGAALIFLSGGDPAKRQSASKILQGVAIGLALVIGSTLIVNQMLFVIFNRTFGEAIKDNLKTAINQGQNIGLTAAQADNVFGFDNISCTVIAGGIEFNPYSTKKPDVKTNATPTETIKVNGDTVTPTEDVSTCPNKATKCRTSPSGCLNGVNTGFTCSGGRTCCK